MKVDETLALCEEHRASEKYSKAFDEIRKILNQPDIKIQYALARLCWESCNRNGQSPAEREPCLQKLQAHLERNPNNADTHRSIAMLLAMSRDHLNRAALTQNEIMKKHIIKAIENNPNDGYAHYMLGMWCFEVANATLQQRRVVSMLTTSPPTSTFEEALDHFQKAEKLIKDNNSGSQLMIAQCLLKLGRKQEAVDFVKKCASHSSKSHSLFRLNAKYASVLALVNDIDMGTKS